MKKSVLFASLAVVSFSVLGMENVPNFGNDPSHCPEQNRVNVSETNLQNWNYANSAQTLNFFPNISLNGTNLQKKIRIKEKEREDILSQIIENKQFEEIQRTYPKLSKQVYDNYVRYIKYWFSFKEQEVFKKKINGEELDKELKHLDLELSTLDTNALADLILLSSIRITIMIIIGRLL